jgi:hypothetical protein
MDNDKIIATHVGEEVVGTNALERVFRSYRGTEGELGLDGADRLHCSYFNRVSFIAVVIPDQKIEASVTEVIDVTP